MDWEAQVKDDNGKRTLIFTKQKEMEKPRPFGFTLEAVHVRDGVNSAVPVICEFDEARHKVLSLGQDAEAALTALQFSGAGSAMEEKAWRQSFFDSLGTGIGDAAKRQKFARAKKKLVDAGLVKIEGGKVSSVESPEEAPEG
jgi:hypothetical protein